MNTDHLYLTNGACENAGFVGVKWMEQIGLDFGEVDGFFYPLTETEAHFVGTDNAVIGESGLEAWLSYSVLYRNRKWLAPVIEIAYKGPRCTGQTTRTRDIAKQASKLVHDQLIERVHDVGGYAFKLESTNRFWIEIILPFSLAMMHGDFKGWKGFLEDEFFTGISLAEHQEPLQACQAHPNLLVATLAA